ncbi:MAG: hypothetical protein JJE55_14230 [Flavobacteriaceae bacterium]|nr:hypothetical protein [Flavobacteriaceae bacterium]
MVKKTIIFLLMFQLFAATQCEGDDDCGYSDFTGYDLFVENTQLSYSINDTIWINSSASSKVIDYCTQNNDSVINYNRFDFKESFYPLKLKNGSTTNAEISLNDFQYIIATGFDYNPSFCHNSYYVTPVLSNNETQYKFRIGIIPKAIGDYAISSGSIYPFDTTLDLNTQVFSSYNNFDDLIKFENCGDMYTRYNLRRNNYFFIVE